MMNRPDDERKGKTNMATIRERLAEFAKAQGLSGLGALEKECGFHKNTLTKDSEGMNSGTLARIVERFPRLSLDWAILGKGDMIKQDGNNTSTHTLPLIPMEAFAGPGMPVYEDIRTEDYYTISDFKSSDFLIRVTGDSMTPKYNGGDIVACKKVTETYFLQWGRVYVIYTQSQGIMIKRVQPSDRQECIKCVSDNPKYAPFDVPKDDIVAIALVNGAITLE